VKQGVYPDGKKIAVKVLKEMQGIEDKEFKDELKIMTKLRHQNIVQLFGYCHDIQEIPVLYEGKLVLAEKRHRALCLEYMSNGSLDKFLSGNVAVFLVIVSVSVHKIYILKILLVWCCR
jgi:serine/threonine protein kinase